MEHRCFVDMNELEQAAVETWIAHNSLDTLLEREMPESGDTVVPTQLVPEDAAVAAACIATSTPRSNPITSLCASPVVVVTRRPPSQASPSPHRSPSTSPNKIQQRIPLCVPPPRQRRRSCEQHHTRRPRKHRPQWHKQDCERGAFCAVTAVQLLEDLRSLCVDNKLWFSSMNVSTDSTGMVGKVVVSVVGTSEADEVVERVKQAGQGQLLCAIVGAHLQVEVIVVFGQPASVAVEVERGEVLLTALGEHSENLGGFVLADKDSGLEVSTSDKVLGNTELLLCSTPQPAKTLKC